LPEREWFVPARWLNDHAHLLPTAGDALDVACGRGRHALWLAARGLRVHAVDRDQDAIDALQIEAERRGLEVSADAVDLESGGPVVAASSYDVIVAVHYLHRPLFPQLVAALRPGGVLVYETFTTAQAVRGKPTNPAFLLEPGELRRLVVPLEVLAQREGEFDGRAVASIVALRVRSGLHSPRTV
jgi:2-polyprenyl-3-methyl-5-hydroxy-6-metoxy-1,4-benzoquinol methylase